MKVSGLDHIAIVTKDLLASVKSYETMLDLKVGEVVSVPDQGVMSTVISFGNAGIELMQPINPESAIQKYIEKKGEGIHHIALKVDDLNEAESALNGIGMQLIVGTANGNKSVFIHPKSTGGVLIELCECKSKTTEDYPILS